jgi:1-acyl-sn-glycerol-3-phosphate acyltransferase
MFTRRLLNFILRIVFKLLLNLEVVGLENVPLEGPLILMINHTHLIDPAMAGGVMPREIVAMSKAENFRDPILGIIVRLYGAFPVRRGEVDLQATRRALEVLHHGEVLLMAPEGTRSQDCRLQPGHDGTTQWNSERKKEGQTGRPPPDDRRSHVSTGICPATSIPGRVQRPGFRHGTFPGFRGGIGSIGDS